MQIRSILIICLLVISSSLICFLLVSVSSAQADSTSYALFERAIRNPSTAPNFVLITVVNDKTRETEVVCTEAPFLLGAIHRERDFPYDDSGQRKAEAFALAQKDRIFHFSRPDALNNLTRYYTKAQLNEIRTALKSLTDEEILKGFSGYGTGLDKLYMEKGEKQYSAYRDAIAHVLLEKGLLPRRGCLAGFLTVER